MEIFGKLGIDGVKLIFQIINFLIVLYFLNRWVYKPLLGILAKRRDEIAETIARAEKVQEDGERAKEQVEAELENARVKSAEIVARAQKQAEETRKNAQDQGAQQAEEIVANAKKAMTAEKDSLMSSVRGEISNLVVAASAKVIGKEVEGKHENLIQEELKDLGTK